VSCWHPDVEIVHPMRPDRSWSGRASYRRFWSRQWAGQRRGRNTVLLTAVVGNRVFLEGVTEHEDGTLVPNMNIFEVEDGMIRRGRVYTDVPRSDGVSMDEFVNSMNPEDENG
jgi:limonene-1,2-epoxide hydrolase